ncbi:MAG: PQQ-binding-like beta-propeller repeat protein [Verrucomicrobia bacterium]|nr:PQQ-binding-like beta-propeller repeat protein [Verrucomicrobiota bacterium]
MRNALPLSCFLSYLCVAEAGRCVESNWPQFRGPNSQCVSVDGKPPAQFGTATNLLWKVALPPGHSSPCIWGDRIFLTSFEDGKLQTLCLDRRDGKVFWRVAAPTEKIEPVHRIGSPACPTPATDGERVYVYFGSLGLIAYDFSGREVWRRPLPIPLIEFGTGTSPVLAGESILLLCDQDLNSFLMAVDRRTGHTVWKTERPEFRRSFSTPYLWRHDGVEEIVVTGTVWLKAYNLKDGKERWKMRGLARVANASPTSGDGLLFASSWNIGADARDHLSLPSWSAFTGENDKDKNGKLTKDEFPAGPIRDRFTQIDLEKDGFVTEDEWRISEEIFTQAENALFAVRPGGRGDITESHLAWKQTRGLPYVPSALFYEGRVYVVKNGGMASCYEAKTGRVLYQEERLGALGDYYASPVAADDKVYFASQQGVVTVVKAGDTFHVLARNDLEEPIMATPAIVDGHIYLRTANYLSAFGQATKADALNSR